MTFLALIAIWFFYKSAQHSGEGKTFRQIWNALLKVCSNGRLIILILIITGFWMVQHQLYATMPKYVLRLAGEGASPSWYANVNPFGRSAVCQPGHPADASPDSPYFDDRRNVYHAVVRFVHGFGKYAESGIDHSDHAPGSFYDGCRYRLPGTGGNFISPRFLEYFSCKPPKGEEGLYLGFSHLHSFLSSILGFGLSGYLLSKYCPDESLFATRSEWLAASSNAHYIWYYFAVIALASAIALIIYVPSCQAPRSGKSIK